MHASQSSRDTIQRIAAEAAARGASVVLSVGPSRPPAQPAAAGPGPVGIGGHSQPQPSGPAHSQQNVVSGDPYTGQRRSAKVDPGEESIGQDVGYEGMGAMEDCPAVDSAEDDCPAAGGDEDDGFCSEDAVHADVDGEYYSTSVPRTFANPLIRDHEPREQQLEMLIPPHAFPWVAQRIMGGGQPPQAALTRIAAFIDQMFMSDQQESCEALQMPSAHEQPATQCSEEPPLLSTNSRDEAQHEPSAEQRT